MYGYHKKKKSLYDKKERKKKTNTRQPIRIVSDFPVTYEQQLIRIYFIHTKNITHNNYHKCI